MNWGNDKALPADLTGGSALDLGGYDGSNARDLVARGASPVTLVDNREYLAYGWSAPEGYPDGVVYVEGDLMDYHDPADYVVCSNVIYHLTDPFACLAHLRRLTRRVLALTTSYRGAGDARGWTFYPDGTGHPNGTVWCRPSIAGLVEAAHEAGFAEVEEVFRQGDQVTFRCA